MDASKVLKTVTEQIVLDTRDESKPFSSGKTGWYGGGKVVIDGARYQVSLNVVKITPKA